MTETWLRIVRNQFFWRLGKGRVFCSLVFCSLISLGLSEWGWRNSPSENFYLAPTRAWELFVGSIAAFMAQKYGVQKSNAISLIGLVAIISGVFAYDKNTPFPSVYALAPVAGTLGSFRFKLHHSRYF